MKSIYDEAYQEYKIKIEAKYITDHFDWDEKYTNAVKLYYTVTTPWNTELIIDDYQWETFAEKKPKRFLFWKFHPKLTFEESVRNGLNELIEYVKDEIDKRVYENKMTDGLLDSLRK